WLVDLDKKHDFIGKKALKKIKKDGPSRKLVGVEVPGEEVVRPWLPHPWPVRKDGKEVGTLTALAMSPRLRKNIGYAWVPVRLSKLGTEIEILTPAGPRVLASRQPRHPVGRRGGAAGRDRRPGWIRVHAAPHAAGHGEVRGRRVQVRPLDDAGRRDRQRPGPPAPRREAFLALPVGLGRDLLVQRGRGQRRPRRHRAGAGRVTAPAARTEVEGRDGGPVRGGDPGPRVLPPDGDAARRNPARDHADGMERGTGLRTVLARFEVRREA